jgi:two-component system, OmpR family, sensor histidine kinase KdpD
MRTPLRPAGRSPVLAALVVGLAPAAATIMAFPLAPPAAAAASLYFLAVVVAAWGAGVVGGVAVAVLSAAALNFFFTPPEHTLRVEHPQDVVALVVFLLVALIVGSVVARALADRERATQRERETRLLNYFATKLLSGEAIQRVLDDFATALLEPFRLASCSIGTDDGALSAVAVRPDAPEGRGGQRIELPLVTAGSPFGALVAVRMPAEPPISEPDLRLLEACAGQAAVAIERARLSEDAEDSRLDAEANRLRAALFSSVSHDLRTPLASIKASVTSLLGDEAAHDPAQRLELLRTVLEETDRLNRVVGNILDLAKVRAGAMAPAKEPVALDEIVESVVHRMQGRLGGVRIRTAFREDLPEISADPVQLDQIVTNLLENAVRFSPPGGEVLIAVAPWREDGVQVRIVDEGPGVPKEERERVFEPFYRRDDGHRAGSGLGLAIARAIVLAHGGRIRIEGTPAGGAAVVFELPAGEPARPRSRR